MNEQSLQAEQGLDIRADDPQFDAAIDLAVDYRGDVTIRLTSAVDPIDGDEVAGYLYDRKRSADPQQRAIRLLPADGSSRITIPLDSIASVHFSGRDTASGRSFDTWMKRYVEKKLAGERAAIDE